jgi:tetratricopeptide (TPR) repeat protein
VKEHKITHLAFVAEENFILQYNELTNPGVPRAQLNKNFGMRLAQETVVPQWLQMIAYTVPEDLKSLNVGVMLFKVNFEQSVADALYAVVLAQIAMGALDEAEKTLNILLKHAGHNFQPWLRKGEILFTRRNWAEGTDFALKGVSLAPPAARPTLYTNIGGTLFNNKQPALAVRVYREALKDKGHPDQAAYLAWILATSPDDSLRNGAEAVQLAEAAVKIAPNSVTYLNTLAAALAEVGRFPEAVQAAERALANAQLSGDASAAQQTMERLKAFRDRKAIRN